MRQNVAHCRRALDVSLTKIKKREKNSHSISNEQTHFAQMYDKSEAHVWFEYTNMPKCECWKFE